ncbi:hypothetical protein [Rhodococcus erythropolis]|uniref:hypothetical protein n=1 Tax=Rhodococcus erythropolis TaxID=1833 RepID=UPI0030139797
MRKAPTADGDTATPTLGFLVKPVAGIGGSVGPKGSNGAGILGEAKRRGAVAGAEHAMHRSRVEATVDDLVVLPCPQRPG